MVILHDINIRYIIGYSNVTSFAWFCFIVKTGILQTLQRQVLYVCICQ